MRYSLFVPLFLTSTLVSAFPGPHLLERQEPGTNTATHCSTPAVRKEWRDLDRTIQQNYISAVKCLATKPARVNNNTQATLYDDFATVHMMLSEEIHFVAQFFPWHRWFVHLYETALKECGYVGSAIYWDWTKDAGPNVVNSPVFDPVTGFGGTGTNITTRSPIASGPFVNFTVIAYADLWPQSGDGKYYNRPHYLERNLNSILDRNNTVVTVPASEDGSMYSERYSETMMNNIMTNGKDFESFRGPFEGIPHGALHDAIGGDMGPTSSPNDPLFFLHHTNVDRWWWKWQHLKNSANALQYTGNTVRGASELNATAADMMPFLGLMGGNDLPVLDVLLTNTLINSLTSGVQDTGMEPGSLVASSSNGSLQTAFTEAYQGNGAQIFIGVLDSYSNTSEFPNVYNKSISIIQLSGMGKSRLVKESAREVFTIPANLRKELPAGIQTYPPPDRKLRSYFENRERKSDKLLQAEYAILLKHIFDEAKSRVPAVVGNKKGSNLAQAWADHLSFDESDKSVGNNCINFYRDVVAGASKEFARMCEIVQIKAESSEASPATSSGQVWSHFTLKESVRLEKLFVNMRQSAKKMLEVVAPRHSSKNECLVYFDEAHNLTKIPQVIEGVCYRSPYHNLGSVLAELCALPIFFIFLSTNSHLRQFAPPASHHPSGRVFKGSYLIPPFTELPFDVFITKMFCTMVESGQLPSLAYACTTQVILSMGRPLWFAHHRQSASLELAHVLKFASNKLTANHSPEHISQSEVAALGVRIGIAFESTTHASREIESQLVESHMRVVYAIPQHREFMRTGSPSKPVLAEAAAACLNRAEGRMAIAGPRILLENCRKGFIARGERGELCGRLLMTIAHDLALPDTPGETLQLLKDPEVMFHRPVPVLAFLRALFADIHHTVVLGAIPVTDKEGEKLQDAFKEAYVSFSHFALAGDSAMLNAESLRTALFRGMAIQAKDNQVSIDAVIPIHMGPITSSITTKTTSAINLQFKNRKRALSCSVDRTITVPDLEQPVISIVFEFGEEFPNLQGGELKQLVRVEHWEVQRTQNSAPEPGPQHDDKHYLFVARGCGPDTYKAIPQEVKRYYDIILASGGLKDDFPRANCKTSWSAVRSLKPEYTAELCLDELDRWDPMGSSTTPGTGSTLKESIIPDNGQGLRTNVKGRKSGQTSPGKRKTRKRKS